MAGRIPDRDIAAIRDRIRIEDIVGEYVSLRRAGGDSMKGLCPFHDEKSPSFHVRPNHGHFHCFGCGEGGDVYSFLQKIEHVTFTEAVEQLADKVGYRINYEGGGPSVQRDRGTRARLVAANAAAQQFYAEQLLSPGAQAARKYLEDRKFTMAAAAKFGCGYAPDGWDTLTRHLQGKGFEFKELEAAGLSRQGRRGPVDRFLRRLLWPIRSLSGEVIGFGARKLYDDDPQAKYVNTPETVLYKKSQVLFGLDLAKRDIAKSHQAVVVEGYTDVMALHEAGVTTAVAACGTAFGDEHLAILRRLLIDDNYFRGEVVFTFDGDAAGQAAARKAFEGDQKIAGKTFVAIAPDGMDPCDLRQQAGDEAVRDLIARRVPMFAFAVRLILAEHNLDTAEGRVEALRRAVPVVAQIKDAALRDDYARQLAEWVGWDKVAQVRQRVREEAHRVGGPGTRPAAAPRRGQAAGVGADAGARPDAADPALWPEREALKAVLQHPAVVGPVFDGLADDAFSHPLYRAVFEAVIAAGGTGAGLGGAAWVDAVARQAPDLLVTSLVSELAVEVLPVAQDDAARYIGGVLARLQAVWVGRQVADLKSRLHRMSPAEKPEEYHALFGDLVALEQYKRGLLERATGDA